MLIVSAIMPVQTDKRGAFVAAATVCAAATRQEAGNISYTVLIDAEDENRFFTFEEWETLEAEAAHMQSEHLMAFVGEVRGYLAGAPVMRRYQPEQPK